MGSGFKTFTAGSVLTASDVQNYLQDQAVMVFGGTAARSSAIGTANFEEGMLTYLTDVDKLQVYTGSSFQDVYPPAATSQGMTLINTTSFSAVSSVSFPNNIFTTTYDDYKIIVKIESSSTNGFLAFRLRASGTDATGADYNYAGAGFHSNGATLTAASETATSSFFAYYSTLSTMTKSMSEITVFNPKLAQFTNLISSTSGGVDISSTGRLVSLPVAGLHKLSTAYDSISLIASAGNITGSMSVFGVAK